MRKKLSKMIIEQAFKYSKEPIFTLVSGKKSNIYFNCKRVTLNPKGMHLIGNIVFDMLKFSNINGIGGLTLGADPIALALSLVAYQRGKSINPFIVRKVTKGYGIRSSIEGNVRPGEKVVIVEDVITTGMSTITAIEKAREEGLIVKRVIALVNREEGGLENIKRYIKQVDAILTKTDILTLYEDSKEEE